MLKSVGVCVCVCVTERDSILRLLGKSWLPGVWESALVSLEPRHSIMLSS